MFHNNTFFVIINPHSGKNRKSQYFKEVLSSLQYSGIEFESRYTNKPMHASIIAQEAIKAGFSKFIVIGGDGTFNEVVQGVCCSSVDLQTFQFVFIPAGTGNDWHRSMFPDGFDLQALDSISDDQSFVLQDIGMITYLENQSFQKDYFINVAGIGFDVFVAQKYLVNSKKSGPISYLLATIKGLLSYQNIPLHISIGEKTIASKCFIAVAGIGKFFAGGMKVLPRALPDNGLLEVTFVKNISKNNLFRLLPTIYSGRFIDHPKVETFRCKALEIFSPKDFDIQIDGEIRGQLPIKIEVIPSVLKVFAPNMILKHH
jgi:diacylglycerol kinase (ATP)